MSFLVKIVTPRGLYATFDVSSITLRLTTGERTILKGHAPLIGALDLAPMHLIIDGETKYFALLGGAININEGIVNILTNAIEAKEDIDIARALEAKARAEQRLKINDPNIDVKRAELALKRALVRISTSSQ